MVLSTTVVVQPRCIDQSNVLHKGKIAFLVTVNMLMMSAHWLSTCRFTMALTLIMPFSELIDNNL